MFNLIMRSVDWNTGREIMPIDRIFEYTDEHIANQFRQNSNLLFDKLTRMPCLFMNEGKGEELAFVGQINRPHIVGSNVSFEYTLDSEVPNLRNSMIYGNRIDLNMHHDFEFSRNHWALKDVDLYRFLLRNIRPRRHHPTVFKIPEHEDIDLTLVSAMMPFENAFDTVYDSIQKAANNVNLFCRRADNIYNHPSIMQDVVSLIDRSRIVVCDCSGRNPNVFYEAGIAHSLGRETIIITQSENDIPFDLKHLRYIRYLNNEEGRAKLTQDLQSRMQTILGH